MGKNFKWLNTFSQARIGKTVKANLEIYLLDNYVEIKQLKEFDDLIKLLRGINGIGSLTSYDVSTRLGICFVVTPKKVYLHRGTYTGV